MSGQEGLDREVDPMASLLDQSRRSQWTAHTRTAVVSLIARDTSGGVWSEHTWEANPKKSSCKLATFLSADQKGPSCRRCGELISVCFKYTVKFHMAGKWRSLRIWTKCLITVMSIWINYQYKIKMIW